MIIIYRDTDLKEHKIDLSNAVDIKVLGGIKITKYKNEEGLSISTDNGKLLVTPKASNCINVKEEDL